MVGVLSYAQQIYPVTATVSIIPPYNTNIVDMASSGKLRSVLVLNDFNRPSYDVICRIEVQHNGSVIMRTKPSYRGPEYNLTPGAPFLISPGEMAEYFRPENLDFLNGFNANNFYINKQVPEGAISIKIIAYAAGVNNTQLSSSMFQSMFMMYKKQPPQLNTPNDRVILPELTPQAISFSWQTTNPVIADGGFAESYELEIYRVEPKGSNVGYIVNSSQPMFITTINIGTSYAYNSADIPLEKGVEYAWRVRARDNESQDHYNNKGYSVIRSFTYGGENPFDKLKDFKLILTGKTKGINTIRYVWRKENLVAGTTIQSYKLAYRKAGKNVYSNDYPWHEKEDITDTATFITQLKPNTVYEAKVAAMIEGVYGEFSEVIEIRTEAEKEEDCSYGNNRSGALTIEDRNANILQTLLLGDIVKVGGKDFDLMVTEITSGSGAAGFNGKGYVNMPLWMYAAQGATSGMDGRGSNIGKMLVTFKNLVVNENYVRVSGIVNAISDPVQKAIDRQNAYFNGGSGTGNVVTGDIFVDIVCELPILNEQQITVDEQKGIINIVDANGNVVKSYKVPEDTKGKTFPIVIEDKDGNRYQVNKNGKVTSLGKVLMNSPTQFKQWVDTWKLIKGSEGLATFSNAPDSKYSFDAYDARFSGAGALYKNEYQKITVHYDNTSEDYYEPIKAITPNTTDKVLVHIRLNTNSKDIKKDALIFVTGAGMQIPVDVKTEYNGPGAVKGLLNYELSLTGGPANDAQVIYVVIKKPNGQYDNLGQLKLVSYAPQQKKLALVKVGDAQIDKTSIEQTLAQTYGALGITYTVDIINAFKDNIDWDADGDRVIKDTRSAIFSNNFTGEQKEITRVFKTWAKANSVYDANTAYIFYSNSASNNPNLLGEMPRDNNGQFGFLFVQNKEASQVAKTVAHELGHGQYTLEHAFDEAVKLPNDGANLMDYSKDGITLHKYQWDIISKPGVVWGITESDEAAQERDKGGIEDDWRNIDKTVNFLTPTGKIVRLPATTTQAYFSFGIGEFSGEDFAMLPSGVLTRFEITEEKDGKQVTTSYIADWNGINFKGYINATDRTNATCYLPKDNAKAGAGDAILSTYDAKGSNIIKLIGLPNGYYEKNSEIGEPFINIIDASATQLRAYSYNGVKRFLYSEKQIQTDRLSATSPSERYADMLGMLTGQEDIFACNWVLTKIYEYRIMYPDMFDKMTTGFGNWSAQGVWTQTLINDFLNTDFDLLMSTILSQSKVDFTAGYFEYYLRKKGLYLEVGKPLSKLKVFTAFLTEFKKMIALNKTKNATVIAALLEDCRDYYITYPRLGANKIKDAIETMSVEQLAGICVPARTELINIILERSVVEDSYENAIYKLMWSCPEGVTRAQFLQQLSTATNNKNQHILGILVKAVDDKTVFMGKNFNTMIMNYIIEAYKDYKTWVLSESSVDRISSTKSRESLLMLKNLTPESIKNLSKKQLEDFQHRIVTYNYVSFAKRLCKQALPALIPLSQFALSNDTKSVVNYNGSNGTITYTNKALQGFVYVGSSPTITFDALEPIVLDDKAKLIDVYSKSQDDGGVIVPAIVLYFLEEKGNAKTLVEGIGTLADAASLAVPGGQATLALKLLNYADKASALSSILSNATADDYPQFSKFLNVTSTMLGLIDVGNGALVKLKSLANIKDATGVVNASANVLSADGHTKAVADLCGTINDLSVNITVATNDIEAILINGNKEKELLISMLEIEKTAAKAADNNSLVSNIEAAIRKLSDFKAGTKVVRSSRIQNMFATITNKFKSIAGKFTKTTDGKYITNNNVQIAHINNSGELVMDKLDNLSDLGDAAKLEANIKDAAYIKKTNNAEAIDDLLIFDDNGIIKVCTGGNCFVSGTQVHTKNGITSIETIQENDIVLSYNETAKTNSWQKVTNVFNKTATKLQRIITSVDTLWATPEHKFYAKAKGWVQAAALTTGMLLQTETGVANIVNNTAIDSTTTVYNFTVANTHTYYVGKTIGLLTHNDCGDIGDFLASLGDRQSDFIKYFGKEKTLIDKFVTGKVSIADWDALIKSGVKESDWVKMLLQGVGNDIVAEINRIKNLRKNDLPKRIEELGKDLDKNSISLTEGKAGAEIEETYGYFDRFKSTADKKGDWISLSGEYKGKTFDEIGGNLGETALSEFARKPSQKSKFFESIDLHFTKADYVVLNLTEMKRLQPSLYEETLSYISTKFGNSKLINISK